MTDKKILSVIQVYAPTSLHPDEEVEEFYDLLDEAYDEHRGCWTIKLGDFNAKLGIREDHNCLNVIGPHGVGTRK